MKKAPTGKPTVVQTAASAMGRRRWENVPAKKRSRLMKRVRKGGSQQ